ncbi:ComEC/Rec2 family competence protein [Streptomyces apocyni]|uniref:ComEC/Rec2 family competence protein n=1 Tax=Streptomyces apocyni TaxID=2654677 RepID=UPI0012E993F0|nr:ComEC/Rec2 family competence protein [Streptomyces apocyni]
MTRDPATTRDPVHSASGNRLGAANPRQEAPADLRLIPPALAAWAAAALALGAPGSWAAVGVALCVAAALILLAMRRRRRTTGVPGAVAGGGWVAGAAVLLCAAAGAASAGLHAADLHRGPVPDLASQHARAMVELRVSAVPRQTRPRVSGARTVPPSVVLEADVVRVSTDAAAPTQTRTPVLVVVRTRAVAHDEANPSASRWLGLLPSTRIRAQATFAPPFPGSSLVAAVARVDGSEPPHIVERPTALQRVAGHLRAGLRAATEDLPPDARALLPGLVVGDTSRVPSELREAFLATDLTHLLAVSGANFTILLALLIGPPGTAMRAERGGLAPRLGIPLRLTALLGGVLTLGFVVVCGLDPSVLRAAACGLIALLAIATGRRRSLLPALAAAVLLLVLYEPWLARSYGFVLSVLATGALLTVAPRWSAALRRRRVPPRIAEALAAAAAAQAVCAPVVAVFAAHVSLVAVPCNLLAEFAVAPATVLGFAALAVAPVSLPLAKTAAWCASLPTGWIADIARTGAALPGADADWPGGWRGGLLLAALTAAAVPLARRLFRCPALALACALLLLLAIARPVPLDRALTGWPPPGWRLVVCDVGQGDALVLAAGEGTAVVVDAGPDPVLADRCLRSLGITRVPLVVLTHFHADHTAGLPGVLKGREVGGIQATRVQEPAGQAAFVGKLAAAHGIPLTSASAGEHRRSGALSWQVLWPPAPPEPIPEGANDASVTLLVRTGGLTLLLAGDLEPPSQQALLRITPGLGPVDVLKVAHHGSAYQDPELLRRIRPRLALISCGADNSYGHPAPSTLTALHAQGTAVLRTDTDGAVAVTGAGPDLRAVPLR